MDLLTVMTQARATYEKDYQNMKRRRFTFQEFRNGAKVPGSYKNWRKLLADAFQDLDIAESRLEGSQAALHKAIAAWNEANHPAGGKYVPPRG